MLKCNLSQLDELFAAVAEAMPLYLPTQGKNGANYTKWQSGAVWSNT